MPAIAKRVTKAQVAVACGLTLAFQPIDVACRVAGVSPKLMNRLYLPKGWASLQVSRSPHFGDRLKAIRAAWENPAIRSSDIRAQFDLTPGKLRHLCKRFDFPKRPVGRRPNDTRALVANSGAT